MKERIREKITKHIETILAKDVLTFEDYQILSSEAYRLEIEEKNKELEDGSYVIERVKNTCTTHFSKALSAYIWFNISLVNSK